MDGPSNELNVGQLFHRIYYKCVFVRFCNYEIKCIVYSKTRTVILLVDCRLFLPAVMSSDYKGCARS